MVNVLGFGSAKAKTAVNGRCEGQHTLENRGRYEYTVDDPTTFTRPFTAVIPMQKSEVPIFEYACHEGNYGLFGTSCVALARTSGPPLPPRRNNRSKSALTRG